MNRSFLTGITLGVLVTVLFFHVITTQASKSAGGKADAKAEATQAEKKEEGAEGKEHGQKAKHGKEEAASEPEKPKVDYVYYPDVKSIDDLTQGAVQESADPGVKVVYKTPASCKEFSMYLESKGEKLARYDDKLKQKERFLDKMQKEFEESLKKFAAAETRVRQLVNADPTNLKDNPEVAKMIKLYESISAEEAAERLKNLDLDLTVTILKGMQPKKLSKIMTAMDPKLSAALSSRMVRGF